MRFANVVSNLYVILLVGLLVRIGWALLIPPFEGADELAHCRYVLWIVDHGQLPVMGPDAWKEGRYEDYQAPLYYIAMAIVWKICNVLGLSALGSLLAMRIATALASLSIIVLCLRTVRILFPSRPEMASAAGWLAACLPMLAYNSVIINNDTFLCIFGSGVFLCLVQLMCGNSPGRKPLFWLGLCLVGALYSKASAVLMFPAVLLAALLQGFRQWSLRELSYNLLPLVAAFILTLPLWLRNYSHYKDPFGVATVAMAHGAPEFLPPTTREELARRTSVTVRFIALSWWASFGRFNQVNAPWSAESLYVRKLNICFYTLAFFGPLLSMFFALRVLRERADRKSVV